MSVEEIIVEKNESPPHLTVNQTAVIFYGPDEREDARVDLNSDMSSTELLLFANLIASQAQVDRLGALASATANLARVMNEMQSRVPEMPDMSKIMADISGPIMESAMKMAQGLSNMKPGS